MQVFSSTAAARQALGGCVATIGKYDGMHLGHQRILDVLKQESRAFDLPSVVVLSEPQPEEFFTGAQAPPRLNAFQDKVAFLEDYGIDAVFLLDFDAARSRQQAEAFIREFLVAGLGLQSLVIGDDFRFGRDRGGDINLLRQLAPALDYRVVAVPPCQESGERVSSTLVRQYLQQGNCERVAQLLGRPYSISGEIVLGRQLGRQIGVPTANVALRQARLPMTGVFAVRAELADGSFPGVANLGYKPTVSAERQPTLEVHLLDVERDLYGQHMRVHFLRKLRDERKFDGLDALKAQIGQDIAAARAGLSMMAQAVAQ